MKTIFLMAIALLLAACAGEPPRPQQVAPEIIAEMKNATQNRQQAPAPEAVNAALLPPLRMELPNAPRRQVEPKFDLVVNGAPAREVFMSIVSGTRYSMVVHPDVGGALSLNLKDVTVREALEAIREVYGYEFRMDGARIYIQPSGLQTRVFQVNYLIGLRAGRSDVRVSSGTITGNVAGQAAPTGSSTISAGGGTGGAGGAAGPVTLSGVGASALSGSASDASRVSTVSQTDFWTEIQQALRTLVGPGEGRSVVVSPQSGVVVVRAMPQELRSVDSYLKAMRLSVERQVMIEAKIIDVTLNEAFQSGVNWAAFPTSGLGLGTANAGVAINTTGALTQQTSINPGARNLVGGTIAGALANVTPAAGLFGLAFQTQNFATLLQFLEAQGSVQVLSSPRVATLNNQKAVLKVGTDRYFVTNITGTPITTTTGATTNVQLTPTFNSFFSGISLDITPQINEDGNILLHVHPLVSTVSDGTLRFDFGTGTATDVPLAKSAISETDSIVKVQDGNIVALGGLMRVDVSNDRSGLPGMQDLPGVGGAFRNTTRTNVKRELIILLKPTVIKGDGDWERDIDASRERMQGFNSGSSN